MGHFDNFDNEFLNKYENNLKNKNYNNIIILTVMII
jgi:hypothetical protein